VEEKEGLYLGTSRVNKHLDVLEQHMGPHHVQHNQSPIYRENQHL
jgi:hypothetical protein